MCLCVFILTTRYILHICVFIFIYNCSHINMYISGQPFKDMDRNDRGRPYQNRFREQYPHLEHRPILASPMFDVGTYVACF